MSVKIRSSIFLNSNKNTVILYKRRRAIIKRAEEDNIGILFMIVNMLIESNKQNTGIKIVKILSGVLAPSI